jgi:hypothetical protein
MLLDKLNMHKGNESQHALSWLVAGQYLREIRGARTDPIYRLNAATAFETRLFLAACASWVETGNLIDGQP